MKLFTDETTIIRLKEHIDKGIDFVYTVKYTADEKYIDMSWEDNKELNIKGDTMRYKSKTLDELVELGIWILVRGN